MSRQKATSPAPRANDATGRPQPDLGHSTSTDRFLEQQYNQGWCAGGTNTNTIGSSVSSQRSMDTLTSIQATSTVSLGGDVESFITASAPVHTFATGTTGSAATGSTGDLTSTGTPSRTVHAGRAPVELKSQTDAFGTSESTGTQYMSVSGPSTMVRSTTGDAAGDARAVKCGAAHSTAQTATHSIGRGAAHSIQRSIAQTATHSAAGSNAFGRGQSAVGPVVRPQIYGLKSSSSSRVVGGNRDADSTPLHGLRDHLPRTAVEVGNSGRLFYLKKLPRTLVRGTGLHVFNTNDDFVYEPFSFDFGPLHIGHVYNYCTLLHGKLTDPKLMDKLIIHEALSANQNAAANVVLLMCAYQVVMCGVTPSLAYQPFVDAGMTFPPFRDATYGHFADYELTILECLQALEMATRIGWFDYRTFNIEEYEHYEKLDNGDLNWIIPKKFVAFCGPTASEDHCSSPQAYIAPFKKLGIKLVIRLNRKQYNRKVFTDAGIRHADLYFIDGSTPPDGVVEKFLKLSEQEPGAIGVHCKAGLGRTGTLIGLYAIKNYRFPARLWIAWNRLCRPGSILGPQQQYLSRMQPALFRAESIVPKELQCPKINAFGTLLRDKTEDSTDAVDKLKMCAENERVANFGDIGQGERLVKARYAAAGGAASPAASSASTNADSSVRSLPSPMAEHDLLVSFNSTTAVDP